MVWMQGFPFGVVLGFICFFAICIFVGRKQALRIPASMILAIFLTMPMTYGIVGAGIGHLLGALVAWKFAKKMTPKEPPQSTPSS